MTSPPVVVAPRAAARQAALQMDAEAVGCLLVADGEHLYGVVTDRDLTIRALARGLSADAPVAELMSTPVVTLDVTDDLESAYRLFRRSGVRRLPVLDGHRPVGMLAVDDLFRDVLQHLSDLLGPISWSVLRDDPGGGADQATD
ncbi:CBS domain-containing protein [Kitasatospora sp. NBC_01302]|uniref:CBS domain-containing protein n=1 Tax=Kitasatospora sp. NBC_01302 TaxID=2903575 RepID=UPI002E0D8B88|nr:CBS domain-containing protein [Kitasatospora sp. NBC_01302]